MIHYSKQFDVYVNLLVSHVLLSSSMLEVCYVSVFNILK